MAHSPRDKVEVWKESLGDMVKVGSGGFGLVYKARHKDWGFDVAVKILNEDARSVVMDNSNSHTGPQGTFKYMPPEAFNLSYNPVRAFDIYSFGILLWSIFTGKEPYPGKCYDLVAVRIPEGDRPGCEDLLSLQVDGIRALVDLMKICWEGDRDKRPLFKDIIKTTEELFSRHSGNIRQAVDEVLTKLDRPDQARPYNPEPLNDPHVSSNSGSSKTLTREEKAKFVDRHKPTLIKKVVHAVTIAEELGDMVHPETYSLIQAKATPQEQVRVLYNQTLRSGGEKVKAAFYDALREHQPFLVKQLLED